jgi:hypothetical protein
MGVQVPRLWSVPRSVGSRGREAVEFAASVGLILDPWQAFVLEQGLGVGEDGKWSAFEIGLCVPRQNGKGGVIEALELAGLFLFGERLIIHSAHEFATSLEAFFADGVAVRGKRRAVVGVEGWDAGDQAFAR